jgi:hypothetical protein
MNLIISEAILRISEAILRISEAILRISEIILCISLDTFDVSSVNSARMKEILKKGAHCMNMISTPWYTSPVFAGLLPSRSAPTDR